jgi:predicted nuclease of predicted toxin-antitoxin system
MEDLNDLSRQFPHFGSAAESISGLSPLLPPTICPYCHKKFVGNDPLLQHLRAKHGVTGEIPFFSCKDANRLEQLACQLCGRKFPDLNALEQHQNAKHRAVQLLLDENVSAQEAAVQQLAFVYQHRIKVLPTALLGQPDEAVLGYARDRKMGIITRDKRCARVAVQYLSPVYLLVNNKNIVSVVKFN